MKLALVISAVIAALSSDPGAFAEETAVSVSNGTKLRGYAQTIASNHATLASDKDERPSAIDRYDSDEEDEGTSLGSDVELERGRGRGRRGGGRRRGRGRSRGRRRRRGRGSFRSRRGRRFRGSRRFRRGRSFRRGRRFRGSGRCIDRCLDRSNRSVRSCENRCGFFSSESIVDLFYATGGFSEPATDEDLGLYLSATPSADLPMNDPSDDGDYDDYDDEPDYLDDEFDDDDFEDSDMDDSVDEPQNTNKPAAVSLRDVHLDASKASDDYYY